MAARVATGVPYRCLFCGAPCWVHPSDQLAPADYCGEHGQDEAGADEAEFDADRGRKDAR